MYIYAYMISPCTFAAATIFCLVLCVITANGVVGEIDSTQPNKDRYTPGLRC